MVTPKLSTEKKRKLRDKAEERLNARVATAEPPMAEFDINRLVHELQVHKIELDMQNEELVYANTNLAELNRTLEERVSGAVRELHVMDQIYIHQGRMAAMGEMINSIAHQWRQPLNNVGLVAQNIFAEFQSGEMTEESCHYDVNDILETLQFMSTTIDDFRNFFVVEKEIKRFGIRQCVAKMISLMKANLIMNNIRIVVDQGEEIKTDGFPNEYAQVILNILSNARDALLEKSVINPVIHVSCSHSGERSVVVIKDNGGGIPDSIIENIFDPTVTTKPHCKGSGIGLHMSKTIIEKHLKGSLTVRNYDEGAEFRIEV